MTKGKINILIIDDEEEFLKSMTKRLEVRGFNVVAVDRGDKALEATEAHPVDVALVDLKMPGMSGEETIRALKSAHPWMEAIVLTGFGSLNSAIECGKIGAHSYLQKPCEWDRLLGAVVEAYKMKVMNKRRIQEKRMNEILAAALCTSPMAVIEKIRELDEES